MKEDLSLRCTDNYGTVACEPGWRWDTTGRPLEDYDLWYVWDGEGEMRANGAVYRLGRGACFLFRPGDRTSAVHRPDRPLTVTYIHFAAEGGWRDAIAGLSTYAPVRDTLQLESTLSRYVRTMNDRSYRYEREAELLLSLMLQQLEREQWEADNGFVRGERTDRIRETANYIRQHPGVRHTIGELAERAGLSPRYYALKFRETMGTTVEAFLIEARMQRAEHLLRCTGMTVAEVADALGYNSVYFFSRQFKKFRGRPPSRIRD